MSRPVRDRPNAKRTRRCRTTTTSGSNAPRTTASEVHPAVGPTGVGKIRWPRPCPDPTSRSPSPPPDRAFYVGRDVETSWSGCWAGEFNVVIVSGIVYIDEIDRLPGSRRTWSITGTCPARAFSRPLKIRGHGGLGPRRAAEAPAQGTSRSTPGHPLVCGGASTDW